jgi:hypothetical protein
MEEDGCPPDEFSCNAINRGFLRHRDDSRAVLEDSMQFRQLLCSYLVYKKAFQLEGHVGILLLKHGLPSTSIIGAFRGTFKNHLVPISISR